MMTNRLLDFCRSTKSGFAESCQKRKNQLANFFHLLFGFQSPLIMAASFVGSAARRSVVATSRNDLVAARLAGSIARFMSTSVHFKVAPVGQLGKHTKNSDGVSFRSQRISHQRSSASLRFYTSQQRRNVVHTTCFFQLSSTFRDCGLLCSRPSFLGGCGKTNGRWLICPPLPALLITSPLSSAHHPSMCRTTCSATLSIAPRR